MDNSLAQAYEVKSFEGGITDFFLQAPNTYYEKGDNFIVNNDLKLEVRWGSFLWDSLRGNHVLDTSRNRRIDNFLLFMDESILFAHSGRDIYYQNTTSGAWTRLTGPTGNEAFSEGGQYSFSTYAQWNGHLFTTTDAGSLPVKMYYDQNNALQVRSVGLPFVQATAAKNDSTDLAACIALANDLRTSMLNHFLDASYDTGTSAIANFIALAANIPPLTGNALHFVKDRSAASYFQTQSSSVLPSLPSPVPTAAGAATDLNSLVTLVVALSKAQQAHMLDANTIAGSGVVTGASHYMNRAITANYSTFSGPNIAVSDVSTPVAPAVEGPNDPSILEQCRIRLNNIRTFWDWHRLAFNTHVWIALPSAVGRVIYSAVTNYDLINRYPLSHPLIPDPQSSGYPVVTPNYGKFIGYVNSLKYLYNVHITNGKYMSRDALPPNSNGNYLQLVAGSAFGSPHARTPGHAIYEFPSDITADALTCELPDAKTYEDACLALYWIRAQYNYHNFDATNTLGSVGFVYTGSAGGTSLTGITTNAGAAVTLPVGNTFPGSVSPYTVLGGCNATGPFGENGGVVVTASGSGTATISKPLISSTAGAGATGAYGNSRFHFPAPLGSGSSSYLGTTAPLVSSAESLSNAVATGSDFQSWVLLATEFGEALQTHTINQSVHFGTVALSTIAAYFTAGTIDSLEPVSASYVYAFVYKLTYQTVNGITFEEFSNPIQVGADGFPVNYPLGYSPTNANNNSFLFGALSVTNAAQYGAVISGIPPLANTPKTNYDLTAITIQIYRTIDTGTTFYLLAEIPNGQTTYIDVTNDTLTNSGESPLNTRETLYTTGGVVGFDQMPRSRFVHILQNTAIYAGIWDGDQYFPNRLLQSIPGTPAATNLTFFDDLEEAVTGISSTGSNFVAWTLTKTYRLGGGFNELGQGNLSHERISDNVGCIGAGSIVQTDLGIYFAGNDGFYFTDGYNVSKVSAHIDKTYQKYTQTSNQRARINGCYDRQFRRVYWTMQADPSGIDCGHIFVLHTGYSAQRTNGVFTIWMNGSDFMPSSLAYYKNELLRGDYRGIIYHHNKYSKTDPTVPLALNTSPSLWNTSYIPWHYKSSALDFGSTFKGQWATRIHLTGKNVGNAAIQAATIREINNGASQNLSPIYYQSNLTWGDARITWGDPTVLWEYDKTLNQWRRFPPKSMRSQFRQVDLQPGKFVIYKYDNYPDSSFATVSAPSGGSATVSLLTPTGFSLIVWPKDVVGQTLYLDFNEYYLGFTITAVSGAQITVSDPTNQLALSPSNCKWQIQGFLKEQRMQLSAYDIHFGMMGQRGRAAQENEGGGNA